MLDAEKHPSKKHLSLSNEHGCFVDRIQSILKGRSSRSFAREAGVSETVFRKYASGESEPTRPALLAMAHAAGVRVGWLAAGEGEMRVSSERPEAAPLNDSRVLRLDAVPMAWDLLAKAVEITESVLVQYGIRQIVDSDQFAELVRIIFNDLARGAAEDTAQRALQKILTIARKPP